ncbi:MAG: histidinol-phosphate transaminase [Thermoproteota archaeon]
MNEMKIEELARKEVSKLSLYEVDRGADLEHPKRFLNLNLNENLTISDDAVGKLLLEACQGVDLRVYPPIYGSMATEAISEFFGTRETEVFVGNGADGVLDSLMKVFVEKGSKVVVIEPTFSMYDYFIKLYGGKKVTALLTPDFNLDVDRVLKKCDEEPSLIFICSPNNPTGNQFERGDIATILQEFEGIVVVDEAYADFAGYTVMDWTREFNNLAVIRTFSKASGLAGIRSGFLISNESIVDYVKRATPPFAVNVVTQRLITLALENWSYFQQKINYIVEERKWLRNTLNSIDGVISYPSDANFLLLRITHRGLSSSTVKKRLKNRGVLVKDRSGLPLLENCIRVTVGTHKMNQTLTSALKEVLEEE